MDLGLTWHLKKTIDAIIAINGCIKSEALTDKSKMEIVEYINIHIKDLRSLQDMIEEYENLQQDFLLKAL